MGEAREISRKQYEELRKEHTNYEAARILGVSLRTYLLDLKRLGLNGQKRTVKIID